MFWRLIVSVLLISSVFVTIGGWAIYDQHINKIKADVRHKTRLDPLAVEPDLTAPNFDVSDEPFSVEIGTYIDRIVDLSIKDANWTVDFYLWFRWKGEPDFKPDEFQIVGGTIESQTKETDFTENGETYRLYRVIAKISKIFDVSRFPCDEHVLTIDIEHPSLQRNCLIYKSDGKSKISSRVKLSAYNVQEAGAIEKAHSYKSNLGDIRISDISTYSQYRMGIKIHRTSWGYYFKMFEALYVAVIISMLAMFIKPTNVDPRFGLGVGGLFAAVANMYVTTSFIPDNGTMTLADVVSAIGIWTILLTVVQSVISLYILEHQQNELFSKRLDRVCFFTFAICYLLINIALPFSAS